MPSEPKIADVDAYVAATPKDVGKILEEIRRVVRAAVPLATETVRYQMPAFKLKKVFFYFAAFKKHIGVYPPVKAHGKLDVELARYRGAKGNLQFPLAEPVPYKLIAQVASALAQQHSAE